MVSVVQTNRKNPLRIQSKRKKNKTRAFSIIQLFFVAFFLFHFIFTHLFKTDWKNLVRTKKQIKTREGERSKKKELSNLDIKYFVQKELSVLCV